MNRLKALSLCSIIILLFLRNVCIADSFRLGANIGSFQCLNGVINGTGKYHTNAFGNPGFGNGRVLEIWIDYRYKSMQLKAGYGDVEFQRLKTWTAFYWNGNYVDEYTLKVFHNLYYYPFKLTLSYCPHSDKSKVFPYIGVGAGYYYIKWHEDELVGEDSLWINSTDSQTHTIGIHAILGAEYAVTKFAYWLLECEFNYLKADMTLHSIDDYYNRYATFTYKNNNLGGIAIKTGIVLNLFSK